MNIDEIQNGIVVIEFIKGRHYGHHSMDLLGTSGNRTASVPHPERLQPQGRVGPEGHHQGGWATPPGPTDVLAHLRPRHQRDRHLRTARPFRQRKSPSPAVWSTSCRCKNPRAALLHRRKSATRSSSHEFNGKYRRIHASRSCRSSRNNLEIDDKAALLLVERQAALL